MQGSDQDLMLLQYDVEILDPSLGLTESQCIVHAKNYTIQTANPQGTRPANVYNFCATGICNYAYPNGTTGTSVSPYAGSHTASTCTLGYSSAVDNNEVVEIAYLTSGQGAAGESNTQLITQSMFSSEPALHALAPTCSCFALVYVVQPWMQSLGSSNIS